MGMHDALVAVPVRDTFEDSNLHVSLGKIMEKWTGPVDQGYPISWWAIGCSNIEQTFPAIVHPTQGWLDDFDEVNPDKGGPEYLEAKDVPRPIPAIPGHVWIPIRCKC